jgi:hydrogenase 3 maturation protease
MSLEKPRDKTEKDPPNPFTSILRGTVVFIGIGNTLRGDDGLGPALVERLKSKVNFPCINGGDVPENYFGKIVKEQPDTVVLIDAVQLFLDPGDYRILTHTEVLNTGFSTHNASPSIFMEHLERETGAQVYMIGIQPHSIDFGNTLSGAVKRTLTHLERLISAALRQ